MLLLLVVDDLVKKFSGGGRVDGREDGMWWVVGKFVGYKE